MTTGFEYEVVGRWPFPLDMLRRDRSQAATHADQQKIDLYTGPHDPGDGPKAESVTIRLVIPDAGPRDRPLTARWEAFGWKVPGDVEHAAYQRIANHSAARRELRRSAMAKLTPEEREALHLDENGDRTDHRF